jgi:hypothetical protein
MRKYSAYISFSKLYIQSKSLTYYQMLDWDFSTFFLSVAKRIPVHSTHINTLEMLRRAGISTVLCTVISSVPIASSTSTNFLLASSLAHGVFWTTQVHSNASVLQESQKCTKPIEYVLVNRLSVFEVPRSNSGVSLCGICGARSYMLPARNPSSSSFA